MKWIVLFLVPLVTYSCVLCDGEQERNLYERRTFLAEVDRLFETLYFNTFVRTSQHVLETTVKPGRESKPLPSPEWSPHEPLSDDVSRETLAEELDMSTTLSESKSPSKVSRKVSGVRSQGNIPNREAAQEGSGGSGWFEEDVEGDYEGDYDLEGSGEPIEGLPGRDPVTERPATESSILFTWPISETEMDAEYLQCGIDLKKEVYACVERSLTINTFLNQLMHISQLTDDNDASSNYSSFKQFLQICSHERIIPSNICSKVDGHHNMTVHTITQQMIQFACNGAGEPDFRCFTPHMSYLEQYLYSRASNNQVEKVSILFSKSEDLWTLEDCSDLRVIQSCFVDYVEKYDSPDYRSPVKAMLDATIQFSQCDVFDNTSSPGIFLESDSVSEATVRISLGTVITFFIGILTTRF